jgi:hypothetical protein
MSGFLPKGTKVGVQRLSNSSSASASQSSASSQTGGGSRSGSSGGSGSSAASVSVEQSKTILLADDTGSPVQQGAIALETKGGKVVSVSLGSKATGAGRQVLSTGQTIEFSAPNAKGESNVVVTTPGKSTASTTVAMDKAGLPVSTAFPERYSKSSQSLKTVATPVAKNISQEQASSSSAVSKTLAPAVTSAKAPLVYTTAEAAGLKKQGFFGRVLTAFKGESLQAGVPLGETLRTSKKPGELIPGLIGVVGGYMPLGRAGKAAQAGSKVVSAADKAGGVILKTGEGFFNFAKTEKAVVAATTASKASGTVKAAVSTEKAVRASTLGKDILAGIRGLSAGGSKAVSGAVQGGKTAFSFVTQSKVAQATSKATQAVISSKPAQTVIGAGKSAAKPVKSAYQSYVATSNKINAAIISSKPAKLVLNARPVLAFTSSKAFRTVSSFDKAVQRNMFGRLARGTALAYGQTQAVQYSVKQTGRTFALSKEDKESIKGININQAIGAGFTSREQKITGWRSIANYGLPFIGNYFDTGNANFATGVRENLQSQGLSGEKLNKATTAALKLKNWGYGAETASLLNLARFSERFGRKEVALSFNKFAASGITIPGKKVFGEIFKRTFFPIGRAGIVEGSLSQFAQNKGREQKTTFKDVAFGGGLGFLSAGILGGTIAGADVASKSKVSFFTKAVAYTTDWGEKPGDLLADLQIGVSKKLFKTNFPEPRIRVSGEKGAVFSFQASSNQQASQQAASSSQKSSISKTLANVRIPEVNLFPRTTTKTAVNTRPNVNTPADTKTNVPSSVVTDVPSSVVTNIFTTSNTNVPPNTNINEETNINTLTDIMTNIFSNVPTMTPIFRIPPPIPLSMGLPGSGAGASKTGKKSYADELGFAISALRSGFVFGGVGTIPVKKSKSSSRKKRGKK